MLERPSETQNKALYIASVETTQNEILAALEQATAVKWTEKRTTTNAEISFGNRALSVGDLSGAFNLVRATSFADLEEMGANYRLQEEFANEILGLEMESVTQTVVRVLRQ